MDNEDELLISKTEKKKMMDTYKKVGETLLSLNHKKLEQIPLDAQLSDALQVAKKIKVGNALNRQMSFIAKLIKENNYENIQAALDQLKKQDINHEKISQITQQWQDKLLDTPKTLSDFINAFPNANRQKLNQLIRHTTKEISTNQEPTVKHPSKKHQTALFQLLRDTIKTQ